MKKLLLLTLLFVACNQTKQIKLDEVKTDTIKVETKDSTKVDTNKIWNEHIEKNTNK